jgi:queuosine precursor transporter
MNEKGDLYTIITALFISILIISNIASTKLTSFGLFVFDAGTILFPISYIFGDILTEVYGYAKARTTIWIGFACSLLAAFTFTIVQYLPAASDWPNQAAYEAILGLVPRIVLASFIAYLVGSFVNAYVLSKLKIYTKGKKMWTRFIGSTVVGQFFDTLIFVTIAFYGTVSIGFLFIIMMSNYVFKVLIELVLMPVTYRVVKYLKKRENLDYFDNSTDFSPFKI